MATVEATLQQGVKSHQAGNLATAANCYAAVLQSDPDCADAWHLSGVLAHQCGRSADGLNYIARAIELNSNDAEYHSNLSAIWRALSHPQSALLAADAAIHLDPHLAPAWQQRGTVLLDLDRTDEAIENFRRALKLGHPAAEVCRNLGLAFQYAGKIDSSIKYLEKSLQDEPLQSTVYFHLANLVAAGKYAFDDQQRTSLHAMANGETTPPKARGHIHYALARDHEHRCEYTTAFENHRLANRFYCEFLTQQKRVEPLRDSFQQLIDLQIDIFDQNSFRHQRCGPNDNDLAGPTPIFIVGMPRSGSTLLAQMLASHAEVSSAGELTTIATLASLRLQECDDSATEELLHSGWLQDAAGNYLKLLSSISSNTTFVIDKMPENFKYLGFIACLFPNARIVHCRRDPRDVCVSAYCQLFESDRLQMETGDLGRLGQNYRHYLRIMQHWRNVLPIEMHEVTYEHLIDDAEGELRRLLSHLDLPWSEDCLNFHEQKSNVRTASSLQVRNPLNRDSLGRWKRYESQLDELIAALGDAID